MIQREYEQKVINQTKVGEAGISIKIEYAVSNIISETYKTRVKAANTFIYFIGLILWRYPLYKMIYMNEDFKRAVLGEGYGLKKGYKNIWILLKFIFK